MNKRVTSRKAFLRLIGTVQVAQGVTWIDPNGVTPQREMSFAWLPDALLGTTTVGVLLVIAGLFCWTSVLVRAKGKFEQITFGAAMIPYTLLATAFLISWLVGTHPTGIVSAISYAGFAYMVWLAAGVTNQPRPVTGAIPTMRGLS